MNKYLVFGLVVVAIVAQPTSGKSFWDDFKSSLDNLGRTVTGSACLLTVSNKISNCKDDYQEELRERYESGDREKAECCAFISFRSCVLKVAERECSDDGKEVADSLTAQLIRSSISQECNEYGPVLCLTLVQWMVIGGVALAVLFLLSCICSCCCGSRRKGRPV